MFFIIMEVLNYEGLDMQCMVLVLKNKKENGVVVESNEREKRRRRKKSNFDGFERDLRWL